MLAQKANIGGVYTKAAPRLNGTDFVRSYSHLYVGAAVGDVVRGPNHEQVVGGTVLEVNEVDTRAILSASDLFAKKQSPRFTIVSFRRGVCFLRQRPAKQSFSHNRGSKVVVPALFNPPHTRKGSGGGTGGGCTLRPARLGTVGSRTRRSQPAAQGRRSHT